MRKLTGLELDILNALYFVEPFEHILEEVEAPANQVRDSLRFLLDNKLVVAMEYDQERRDFKRTFFYDTDDLHAYHYLATKEGLFAHNSAPPDEED